MNSSANRVTPDIFELNKFENPERKAEVIKAVGQYDFASDPNWSELDGLSERTEFDGLEAVPEGTFESGDGKFQVVATVYVKLNYGDGDDSLSSSESFPAYVNGHFDQETAKIDSVDVDTSSFFE